MKKLLLLLGFVVGSFSLAACGDKDDDNIITIDSLPSAAQQFISTHFADLIVNKVTEDNDGYEVHFKNGNEVDFNKNGDWDNVQCRNGGMPIDVLELIPARIRTYVSTNYPNASIVEIDKETYGYNIELNTGVELEFNSDGTFRKVDN